MDAVDLTTLHRTAPDRLSMPISSDTPAKPHHAARRIAIFNVKHSPNLGDGIIAQCLERELRRADPAIAPFSIDLAGRAGFDRGHGKHRATLLSLIERLPRPLRSRLVPGLLKAMVRLRFAGRWQTQLQTCSSVIIGGGALFQDVDQNFPVKLEQALHLIATRDLPVAIASVGVASHWSRDGRRRLTSALSGARIVNVSVRDTPSAAAWHTVIASHGLPEANVAPDPGLLAARHYGKPAETGRETERSGQRPRIGLCVTAPIALRLHHEGAHDDRHLEVWTAALAREIGTTGHDIVLFTNGSPEDRLFRDRLSDRLADDAAIRFAPDFALPQDLAHFIASCDGILAHRLHACIVAYSYRVPTVGFAWDTKLRSFFEQTGRGGFVVDPREASPLHVADLALAAIKEGIAAESHVRLLNAAAAAIGELARQLASPEAAEAQ